MDSAQLRSYRFRIEREKDWARLEDLVARIEKGSISSLTESEIIALPGLYRSTLSSLSVARETSLDQGVIEYLQNLSQRAYYVVYGTRTSLLQRLRDFFVRGWPAAVKAVWKETVLSGGVFLFAAMIGFLLVLNDMDWFSSFVSDRLAGGRNPSASTEYLRSTLYDKPGDASGLSEFSASLFTHNSRVALMAFTFGFMFGIPTMFMLFSNGLMLGAFYALFYSRGLGDELFGWLMIHGTTELFAIVLAGAAGFKIGGAVAFPGKQTRLKSAQDAGVTAATVAFGVVIMMLIAGLIEGFGRQLITSDAIRYSIAGLSALIWGSYFYGPLGSKRRSAEDI